PFAGFHLQPDVYALLWLATLPIALRRVTPVVSMSLTALGVLGTILLRVPAGPVFLVGAFQAGSLGHQATLRVSAATVAATCVLWLAAAAVAGQGLTDLAVHFVVWVPMLGVPWALGRTLRVRSRLRARAQQEEEWRRTYGQRLEVAREVHDVVGHSLAVITMQSGIALHVMDRRPEQARVALEAIHQQSRDALDELRATLALYRGEVDGEGAPRRPQPRLSDLPALIETMRTSGLAVELTTTGRRNGVPAAIDLAGYRIVQESLTNVLRHAGEAQARVTVAYQAGAIEIEVVDDGSARPGVPPQPGGHGIAGMRERSAAVGGTFEAGAMAAGGFRVRARLPLAGTDA
ncbi:MAG: sensor histidine kinase, partial [Candidatus Dormibacteraeota bacterium]|nr:sensor histidine kinase [Candidatus Dormibacteraeota bacterium]